MPNLWLIENTHGIRRAEYAAKYLMRIGLMRCRGM